MANTKAIIIKMWMALMLTTVLCPIKGKCQFTAGFGAGASSLGVPMINLKAGYKATFYLSGRKHSGLIFFDLQQPLFMRRVDAAGIMGLHAGYNIGSFQPVVGYNYHLASYDKVHYEYNGWKLSYGLIKYFKETPFFVSLLKNGKPVFATVGIYQVF